MSRTNKGAKGPGYEYWSRRTGKSGGEVPGRVTKKHTHKIERQQGRKAVDEQTRAPKRRKGKR